MNSVPTYALYGEDAENHQRFWLHCETIMSRSSAYRFEIGLHRHEHFLQFLYIRDGSGDALLPQGVVPLVPPCVIAVPPGPVHGFRFSRDIDGLVITLAPQQLNRIVLADIPRWLRQPMVMPLEPDHADSAFLDTLFYRIAAEYEGQLQGRDALLEAHVASVVLLLSRRMSPLQDDAADPVARRLEVFRDLVSRNFREQLSVEAYAGMMGISPTHLNRIVRQATGKCTHDMISERLMDEAKRELLFTGYSVQQVAENLGFADAAYFSRVFRQKVGTTPKAYRESERANLRNKEHAGPVTSSIKAQAGEAG